MKTTAVQIKAMSENRFRSLPVGGPSGKTIPAKAVLLAALVTSSMTCGAFSAGGHASAGGGHASSSGGHATSSGAHATTAPAAHAAESSHAVPSGGGHGSEPPRSGSTSPSEPNTPRPGSGGEVGKTTTTPCCWWSLGTTPRTVYAPPIVHSAARPASAASEVKP